MGWRRVERNILVGGAMALAISAPSLAGEANIEPYYFFEDWAAAAGEYDTLDFTGFSNGEVLYDQYADLGVMFPDGNDTIRHVPTGFLNDEWGVKDNLEATITVAFDTPRYSIAAEFPGNLTYVLYQGGERIGFEHFLFSGLANFGGVVSDVPFDVVEITDITGGAINIDDLYIAIPAPCTALCIALGGAWLRRPRHRIR